MAFLFLELALQLRFQVTSGLSRFESKASFDSREIRILCIGDSISNTYPLYLEKILKRKDPHRQYKVIRYTKSFLRVKEVYEKMDDLIKDYRPHFIVLMIGKTKSVISGHLQFRHFKLRSSRVLKLLIYQFDELIYRLFI